MRYVASAFRRTNLALIAAAALTAAGIQPVAFQTPPPQAPQTTFRTEANYVRVDAYPTKDGAPVLDLTQEDFEVLEAGVPQKIEQFERVLIRGNLPQEQRIEPSSVGAGRQAAENPRARVFVIFLDVNHVSIEGSHHIRQPLIDTLNRLIGPDDVFAVMTPEMSARDITFARRTTTIEGFLTRYWSWGERNQISKDPVEMQYQVCYPGSGPSETCKDDDRGIADAMIERRRERLTLDSIGDLIRYLRGVREERKAVLLVSEGWRLFGSDPTLARQLGCRVPQTAIAVDPRTGRLTADPVEPNVVGISRLACEKDRQSLAYMDNERDFRTMLDEANGANTSFYPIDPRGLAVFDEPISKPTTGRPPPGSTTLTPPAIDQARLASRLNSLRTIAEATDGMAMVNSNDLARGLARVVNDLSSYYLLGYYSSGKLDGRFHPISVRVKRPGVQVRARRGFLAATPAAMTAAPAASSPAVADAEATARQTALSALAQFQRESPLRVHVATGFRPSASGQPTAAFWVVGEFSASAPPDRDVDVSVVSASGATVGRATGPGGARSVIVPIVPAEPAAGEFTVRVRAEGFGTGTVRVAVPTSPDAGGAIFMRRGPTTGNKDVPTADLRFRRSERIRVDVPTPESGAATARLLDRAGKTLPIPLTATVRDDRDGSRWQTTELALAPLAPGDYLIEMAGGAGTAGREKRTLVAFRVVP